MNKFIKSCFFGFAAMAALAGCNDDGKDIAGVFENEKTRVEIVSEGGNKYNLTVGKDQAYDWGLATVEGDYIIRGRDDEKVFEIISPKEIKQLGFMASKENLIKVSE